MVGFMDRKETKMDCKHCGYCWADLDDEGVPMSFEYCHFDGPDGWAPCEYEDSYEEYLEEDYSDEVEEYEQWLHDETQRELDEEWEDEARWVHEFGQPYDYEEF